MGLSAMPEPVHMPLDLGPDGRRRLPQFVRDRDGEPDPARPLIWRQTANRDDRRRAARNRGWSGSAAARP